MVLAVALLALLVQQQLVLVPGSNLRPEEAKTDAGPRRPNKPGKSNNGQPAPSSMPSVLLRTHSDSAAPYVGPVDTLHGLQRALDACSREREVILLATTQSFLDAAAQTVGMLARYGHDNHTVIVSSSAAACQDITAVMPSVCCVWSKLHVPPGEHGTIAAQGFSKHRLLAATRMSIAARILRLRYNILFLDTDIIIFDDPYKYFKSPPFSRANMLIKGDEHDVNIGVLYVQNAAPDGPVAWVFAEVLDRMLRWAEAPEFILEHTNPKITNFQHLMWDQRLFADAVFSTVLGRPIFQGSWSFQDGKTNESWVQAHEALIAHALLSWTGRAPQAIERISRQGSIDLVHFALRRPFTSGVYPESLGGRGFPDTRGEYSTAWQQTLRESGPLWPDPDDPTCHHVPESTRWVARRRWMSAGASRDRSSSGGRALRHLAAGRSSDTARGLTRGHTRSLPSRPMRHSAAQALGRPAQSRSIRAAPSHEGGAAGEGSACPGRGRPERAMFLPNWLVSSWTSMQLQARRQPRDWSASMQPPTQVIGHVVYLLADKRIYKNALKMGFGHHDWALANRSRSGRIFFASTTARPVPRVLAPSRPLLDRLGRMGIDALVPALRALYVAAAASGRALAWPPLPCASLQRLIDRLPDAPLKTVVADRSCRNKKPHYQMGAIPLAAAPGMCMFLDYLFGACLEKGVGLLPPELDHLLGAVLPAGEGKQSAANTLDLGPATAARDEAVVPCAVAEDTPGSGSGFGSAAARGCGLYRNHSVASFREAAGALSERAVMYVDALPLLADGHRDHSLRNAMRVALARCWALQP